MESMNVLTLPPKILAVLNRNIWRQFQTLFSHQNLLTPNTVNISGTLYLYIYYIESNGTN